MTETDSGPAYRPSRRADVDVHALDGEAILYDPRSGAVHRFNATTMMVWNACDGSREVAEIARALAMLSAVSADEAQAHVQRAIKDLTKRDLLMESADACPPSPRRPARPDNSTEDPVNSEELVCPTAGDASAEAAPVDRCTSTKPSRREVLCGGATKIILGAPIISTFFATGAYASGPSASAAFGAAGCKTIGYSCSTGSDCCIDADDAKCQSSTCCLKKGESPCDADADCCDGNSCTGGTCDGSPCGDPGELCFVNSDCCSGDCDLGQCN